MPRGSPSQEVFLRLLNKDNIPVDDESIPVFIPEFRLGRLPDSRRPQEEDSMSLEVHKGTVELDHVTLNGMGVEDLH